MRQRLLSTGKDLEDLEFCGGEGLPVCECLFIALTISMTGGGGGGVYATCVKNYEQLQL